MIDDPACLWGYRSVWHGLLLQGLRVPRTVVQQLLKEIDPRGSSLRKAHRLRRTTYCNIGPNYAWHCDGYDKLEPFGFPIHGCIDGWSRKVLWLYVTRSNNQPNNIATYFLDAAVELNGCPVDLVSDVGTENGIMQLHKLFSGMMKIATGMCPHTATRELNLGGLNTSEVVPRGGSIFSRTWSMKDSWILHQSCKWNPYGFVSQKYCRRS